MLVLRTAVLIVSGAQQAALDPDNAYVTEQTEGEIPDVRAGDVRCRST